MNQYDLPEPLARALTFERKAPVKNRFSVTQLIRAPLPRLLLMEHYAEIDEDISGNLWALLGKAIHYVIEKSDRDTEIRIETDVDGSTVVGVVDYCKDGMIIDWKTSSVWSVIFAGSKDWELQLQTYAYLLRDRNIKELLVYMILRDWNQRDARKNPDYPAIPFAKMSYQPWGIARQEAYVRERVSLHHRAEIAPPGPISEEFWCTPEERWDKADKWAVKKLGAARALKVCDTQEEAEKVVEGVKGGIVEYRKGESTRCLWYCSVSPWCPYYLSIRSEGENEPNS